MGSGYLCLYAALAVASIAAAHDSTKDVVVRSDGRGNLQISTNQTNGTVYIDNVNVKQSLSHLGTNQDQLIRTQAEAAPLLAALQIDDGGNLQISTSQANGTVYIDGIDVKQSLSQLISGQTQLISSQAQLNTTQEQLVSTQAEAALVHAALEIDDDGNLQINTSQANGTVYWG